MVVPGTHPSDRHLPASKLHAMLQEQNDIRSRDAKELAAQLGLSVVNGSDIGIDLADLRSFAKTFLELRLRYMVSALVSGEVAAAGVTPSLRIRCRP